MDGFERITGREHEGLVEKCQENGWLKVGGFDWQDDPFLEEYPYEFSRTESLDRLCCWHSVPRALNACPAWRTQTCCATSFTPAYGSNTTAKQPSRPAAVAEWRLCLDFSTAIR